MVTHNINWTMPASSPAEFLIGLPACSTSVARFGVENDYYNIAGVFQNIHNSSATQVGVSATATNGMGKATGVSANGISTNGDASGVNAVATASAGHQAIAVNGVSTGNTSLTNIGLNGPTANGTSLSIACNADVENSSSPQNIGHQSDLFGGTNASAANYGVQILLGVAGNQPGSVNYGGYFDLGSGATATNNYGVFASVPASHGGSGSYTGTLGPDYAGFFNGDVFISGLYGISDKRLKKDITKMQNSLDIIKKLSPVTYQFDQENHKSLSLPKGKQYGFVAQEIKDILPELTTPIVYPAKVDGEGKIISPKEEYIGVNYQGFTAIMVDALKQQQAIIESQQQQINELKALVVANLTNANTTSANRLAVNLSDKDVVVLNQNQPNPFAEQTVVNYNIPQDAGIAQLVFYDATGRQIKSVDITTKGAGSLNVFANDLSNGAYSYTLVVDGKVIDTKKMIKQ